MELNCIMLRILQQMIDSQGKANITDIVKKSGVKRQGVNYNIGKLNQWLDFYGFSQINTVGERLVLDNTQIDDITEQIEKCKISSYVFTAQERKDISVICIALSKDAVSVDYLCELFSVSRNTVLNELSSLKTELPSNDFSLSYINKKGYVFCGSEREIRNFVKDSVDRESTIIVYKLKTTLLHEFSQLNGSLQNTLDKIKNVLVYAEKFGKIKFSSAALDDLSMSLLITHIRNKKGFISTVLCPKEYEAAINVASDVVKKLDDENIQVDLNETGYIALLLLGARILAWDSSDIYENQTVMKFTSDFLDMFEVKACITFSNREELEKKLFTHMLPMYYRLKLHIYMRNPLLEEIQIKYRDLYNLTDLCTKYIEKKYHLRFSPDEIAYLCVYIGGWLRKQTYRENGRTECRILIICGLGQGTSIFVKHQIAQLLGSNYSYETVSERDFLKENADKYALIVSTVKIDELKNKAIFVSPILTIRQKQMILQWSDRVNPNGYNVGRLMEIIKTHSDINNEAALIQDLALYMHSSSGKSPMFNIRLVDLLTPDYIQIIDEKLDFKELIEKCCKPLVENGIVNNNYSASILSIIKKLGLYCQIAPGILLVHAKPQETVRGVGLSFTVLRNPVKFLKKDMINMVFTLASEDNVLHTEALSDLLKIISDPLIVKKLSDNSITKAEEIYKIFCQNLK